MKSHSSVKGTGHARPLTRAQRRAAERVQKRHHARRNSRFAGRVPFVNLIGGAVTILVVLAAVVYGIVRSNASDATVGGLTDPQALSPASSLSVGQQAPQFTLRDANGKVYNLAAQRGHPVVLEYFAVWCPVCQAEAPTMSRLTRDYTPKGVRVWSILANPYGKNYELSGRTDLSLATRSDLSWYATTFDVHHPQLVDPAFGTVNRYGAKVYPGIYVVNRQGKITFAGFGHQSFSKLSAVLDKALGRATMRMG